MIGRAGNELLALLLHHRIERPSCLENPRPKGEISLTENVASPFQAEPEHGENHNSGFHLSFGKDYGLESRSAFPVVGSTGKELCS